MEMLLGLRQYGIEIGTWMLRDLGAMLQENSFPSNRGNNIWNIRREKATQEVQKNP